MTTLVDESAGQILPALEDPSTAVGSGQFGSLSSTVPPEQVACFRDPTFIAALPELAVAVEDAFVTATRLAGVTAAAFVALGVVFSLLLPKTRAGPRDDEEQLAGAIELGAL